MSFLSSTAIDLVNLLSSDGEDVVYTDRETETDTNITTVIHRTGDEGTGFINVPTASIGSPLFGDKVLDANGDSWRISEVLQKLQGRTPCNLKRIEYWHLVTLQEYNDSTDTWTDNTVDILAMVNVPTSSEVISAVDGHAIDQYEIKTTYLTTPTQRMRFKLGTRYLYITGVRPDDSRSKWVIFDCVEEEA